MRLLLAALTLVLAGCAERPIQIINPDLPNYVAPLDVDAAIRIFSSVGFASACAVETYVLTARHAAFPFDPGTGMYDTPVGYAWSDGWKREGLFVTAGGSNYRDIAILQAVGSIDTPRSQTLALVPPVAGDTVRWVEYDLRGRDAFLMVEREAEVLQMVAGHISFDEEPESGASGTCLFNDRGRVVGLVVWGWPGMAGDTGVGVQLLGFWWLD